MFAYLNEKIIKCDKSILFNIKIFNQRKKENFKKYWNYRLQMKGMKLIEIKKNNVSWEIIWSMKIEFLKRLETLQTWNRDIQIYDLTLQFILSLLIGLNEKKLVEKLLDEVSLENFIFFFDFVYTFVWNNSFYNFFQNRFELKKYSLVGLEEGEKEPDKWKNHSYFYCTNHYISRIDQCLIDNVFNILLILNYLAELTEDEYQNMMNYQEFTFNTQFQ